MPEKNWIIQLDETKRILVFLHTAGPRVFAFAVVLVAVVDGEEVCVTRYDTSHGQAHRDVIGIQSGLLEKHWLLDLTTKEAFEYAIKDIKENHGDYIQFYLNH